MIRPLAEEEFPLNIITAPNTLLFIRTVFFPPVALFGPEDALIGFKEALPISLLFGHPLLSPGFSRLLLPSVWAQKV